MFGRYSKLIGFYFACIILLSSCSWNDEEDIKDVFLEIPSEYNHVISKIRGLDTSDVIPVKTQSGIKDQLFVNIRKNQDDYHLMKKIKKAEELYQSVYYKRYEQFLLPDFYQFYHIQYLINPNYNTSDDYYDPLDYNLSVYLSSNILFKMNLKDSSIITDHSMTDLGQTTLDSVNYRHLYKFELDYNLNRNKIFKTVFFDIEKGVIRFETFSNEVFLM